MKSFEPKHLLNAQQQARENRITNPNIRKYIDLLPLEQRVKSTSSVSSSNKSSSYVSPALQSSKERPPPKTKQTPPKTTLPSDNGKQQNSKRPKQKLEQEPEQKLPVKLDLGTLKPLPDHLITEIFKMSIGINAYSLRTWITPAKLNLTELTKNPNSISFFDTLFKRDPEANIHWNLLSENPNAIELLKKRLKYLETLETIDITNLEESKKINWVSLSENPNAIELLEQKIEEENALDPNTLANLNYYQKINWNNLCTNPNAIKLLKANIPNITESILINKNIDEAIITTLLEEKPLFRSIWHIPKATKLLTERFTDTNTYDWHYISSNTSSKAITLLKAKALEEKQLRHTDYRSLSYVEAINWNLVSSNPKAISLLETKLLDEKIWKASRTRLWMLDTTSFRFVHWDKLSSNPNAIALLEAKALEEKQLRDTNPTFKKYKHLNDILKIDWNVVSSNPKAISLLETKAIEENQLILETNLKTYSTFGYTQIVNIKTYFALAHNERINWYILSSNTKAIALLETKIIEEMQTMQAMQDAAPKELYYTCKIDPEKLSANPKAVKLLEKYPDYISLKGLCSNPNAVKLIKKLVLLEKELSEKKLSEKKLSEKELSEKKLSEKELSEKKYTDLLTNEKINWDILSRNPCIFYETS
jgi:hypothetical protein